MGLDLHLKLVSNLLFLFVFNLARSKEGHMKPLYILITLSQTFQKKKEIVPPNCISGFVLRGFLLHINPQP